jgi:hypothetical protein
MRAKKKNVLIIIVCAILSQYFFIGYGIYSLVFHRKKQKVITEGIYFLCAAQLLLLLLFLNGWELG